MKTIIQKGVGLIALITLAGAAHAVPVSITYTGDNIVSFAVACDLPTGPASCGASTGLSLGPNYNNWQVADTIWVDLAPGQYWMSFKISNQGGPAAFLAEIGGAVGAVSGNTMTSNAWQVDVLRPTLFPSVFDLWEGATEYGANGTAIWGSVHGGPIAGISTDAQWIWDSTNNQAGEFITVRGLVTVPEPGTLALLGLGLMGMGMSRRKARV